MGLYRERKVRWTADAVRQRIRTGMLVNRLQNCAAGSLEMTKTQIQAAGILLRKVLPDMVAESIERRPLEAMTDDELLYTIRAIRAFVEAQALGNGMGEETERATVKLLPALSQTS